MARLRYLKNVVTLEFNTAKCMGCGRCTEVCPHGVFVIESAKAKIVDRDACMECGACSLNCPVEAINVKSGVGCATGVIIATLGGTKSTCDCTENSSCCKS